MSKSNKLKFFGGYEQVRLNLALSTKQARIRLGLTRTELRRSLHTIGVDEHSLLEQIENVDVPLTVSSSDAMSLLLLLEVPLSRVLPNPVLSNSDLLELEQEMVQEDVGPVAACGGNNFCTRDGVRLYLRLQAFDEIFSDHRGQSRTPN